MNNTKQVLIKISAILSIVEAVSLIIATIVTCFGFGYIGVINDALQQVEPGQGMIEPAITVTTGMLVLIIVLEVVFAALALTGGILLLKSISDPYKFAERKSKFMAGAICTIIASCAVSIASILLYITFTLPDETQISSPSSTIDVRPTQSEKSNLSNEQIKTQMDILREMKERGEISNEEFKEMMFDLIKKS